MPQLDVFSYPPQIFWGFIATVIAVRYTIKHFLPEIFAILWIRQWHLTIGLDNLFWPTQVKCWVFRNNSRNSNCLLRKNYLHLHRKRVTFPRSVIDINEPTELQQHRVTIFSSILLTLLVPSDDFILLTASLIFTYIFYTNVSPYVTNFIDSSGEAIVTELANKAQAQHFIIPPRTKYRGKQLGVARSYYKTVVRSKGTLMPVKRTLEPVTPRVLFSADLIKNILAHVE